MERIACYLMIHGVLKLKIDDRWVLRQSDLDIASYEVGDHQNLILVCLSVMHNRDVQLRKT